MEPVLICGQLYPTNTTEIVFGVVTPSPDCYLPSQIAQLTRLAVLVCVMCGLSGSIPPQLGRLSNLRELQVWETLTGSLPTELGLLSRLTSINLQTLATGTLPSEYGQLSHLQVMSFRNNLHGAIPTELFHMPSLTVLRLDFEVSGTIPMELGAATSLTEVALCPTKMSGTIPRQLGQLRRLTELSLCAPDVYGTIPSELASIPELVYLELSGGSLTGSVPLQWASEQLGILALSDNGLSGRLENILTSFPTGMIFIELAYNEVVGSIPTEIGLFSRLERFMLQSNRLSGTIPSQLGLTEQLRYLVLRNNQLSGTLPRQLSVLRHLITIDLSDNAFTGYLPDIPESQIFVASFKNNFFRGSLPISLLKANDLIKGKVIYLTRNFLSCDVPNEFDNTTRYMSFVAVGNHFRKPSTPWLSNDELLAPFLFVPVIPDWLVLLIIVSVGVVVLTFGILFSSGWNLRVMFQSLSRGVNSTPSPLSRSGYHHMCVRTMGCLVAVSLCLIPFYYMGSGLYECDRDVGAFSASQLYDSRILEYVIASLLSIFAGFSLYAIHHLLPEPHRDLDESRVALISTVPESSSVSPYMMALMFASWIFIMVVLNIPVILYIFMLNLPNNNSLQISYLVASILIFTFPIILFVTNSIAIPLVHAMYCKYFPISIRVGTSLLVIARLLLIVIVPFISIFVIEDACMSQWMIFWDACNDPLKESEVWDMTSSKDDKILSLLDFCGTQYRSGRCSRRLIEIISHVLIIKHASDAFLRPTVTALATALNSNSRFHGMVQPLLSIGLHSSVQVVTWVEVCVIFGGLSPLVGVVTWLALATNYISTQLHIMQGKVIENHHVYLPRWYLWLSLGIQYVLTSWYFFDNNLGGKFVVVTALPALVMGRWAAWWWALSLGRWRQFTGWS